MNPAERPNVSPEPTAARRAVQTGVRLLLAAGVLFVGYWTMARFTSLLHDREPAAVPNPSQAAGPTTTELARLDSLALSQLGGSWEFLGAGWSLTVGTATDQEKLQFKPPAFEDAIEPPTTVDPVESSLASLFDSLKAARTKINSWATRTVDTPHLFATAQERLVGDSYRIASAQGFIRLGPDQWATISAARSNQNSSAPPASSLMPSVAGVERLAVRRGPAGAVVGEFAKTKLKIDQLLELWQAAGALVTLNEGYGVVDTREGTCNFHGRSLRVILWQPDDRNETTILVLDPSAAEAVPK
jgi:hypothetical protein